MFSRNSFYTIIGTFQQFPSKIFTVMAYTRVSS